jgi:membrane protease YdiL (CAAX protease family)
MVVVFSTHADLVNGARQVQHAIPLPRAIAILLVIIGGFGPFLAALCVTALRSGKVGARRFLSQFRRWRVHPIWYLTAFLGPALLGLVALCLSALTRGATPAHWFSFPPPTRFAGWSIGPWGEEAGWRGYAQPELQKDLGAFGASLVVGALWSLWHYWPVFTPTGSVMELVQPSFFTWLTYEVANSIIMAWLYNSTRGSLPIAWAAHVGLSLGQNLVNAHPIPFGWFVSTFLVAAGIVVLVNGPRALSLLPMSSSESQSTLRIDAATRPRSRHGSPSDR